MAMDDLQQTSLAGLEPHAEGTLRIAAFNQPAREGEHYSQYITGDLRGSSTTSADMCLADYLILCLSRQSSPSLKDTWILRSSVRATAPKSPIDNSIGRKEEE